MSPQTVGPYRVLRPIGQGGTGEVFEAEREVPPHRRVALKVLPKNLAGVPGAAESFRREAEVTARVPHPNVVHIHEIGQAGAAPFVAMELLEGSLLSEVIAREAPMPLERALDLLRPVASALDAARAAGIFHGDLKPGHVMATTGGAVKVFGFQMDSTWVGNPRYRAPEQVRGTPGPWSDVYTLAVIAFEMLAGRVPFDDENASRALVAKFDPPPLGFEKTRPDLPDRVGVALRRGLDPDPALRPPSAEGLVQALAGERELAPAPGRRNPLPPGPSGPRGAPAPAAPVPAQSPEVRNPPPGARGPGASAAPFRFPVVLADPSQHRTYLSWRNIPIASPPALEALAPSSQVRIARRWTERGEPFLRLVHPVRGTEADFVVRGLARDSGRIYALISVAPGFPGGPGAQDPGLGRVEDRDTLFVPDPAAAAEVLGKAGADLARAAGRSAAEAVFGEFPEWPSPEFAAQDAARLEREEEGRETCCLHCQKVIDPAADRCPHCGRNRAAPPCPKCGRPVTPKKDRRIFYAEENGFYPWNHGWDGRCASCGIEFVLRAEIEAGHHCFFMAGARENAEKLSEEIKRAAEEARRAASGKSDEEIREAVRQAEMEARRRAFAGRSSVEVSGDESSYMVMDAWDVQPTIRIQIRRAVGANMGKKGSGLGEQESIALTPKEWAAIREAIEGPLRLLLQRKAYTRDTT